MDLSKPSGKLKDFFFFFDDADLFLSSCVHHCSEICDMLMWGCGDIARSKSNRAENTGDQTIRQVI